MADIMSDLSEREALVALKLTSWTDLENYGEKFCDAFNAGVSACVDALAALPVQQGWQPIETAPRDGTRLWLYWPDAPRDDRQSVGWWHESIHGCWWMDHFDTERETPSHWRELPPAPEASPLPTKEAK
jgi:hypothetical protein